MNDTYVEWLVKRKTPFYMYAVDAVLAVITLICIFLALMTNVIAVILMFLSGFVTYLAFRNTSVEYEYLFVTGSLTIDKILGKSKRKKAWEGTMDEIQIIAPSDSAALNDYKTADQQQLDFSSKMPGTKTYTLIAQSGGKNVKLIFEPNDAMLQCFRQASPRKVIR